MSAFGRFCFFLANIQYIVYPALRMSTWIERKEARLEQVKQMDNVFSSKAREYWNDIVTRVRNDAPLSEEKFNRQYHIQVNETGLHLIVFSVTGKIVRVTARYDISGKSIEIKWEWFNSLSDNNPRRVFEKILRLGWHEESQTVYIEADNESGILKLDELSEMILDPKPVNLNLPTSYGP